MGEIKLRKRKCKAYIKVWNRDRGKKKY